MAVPTNIEEFQLKESVGRLFLGDYSDISAVNAKTLVLSGVAPDSSYTSFKEIGLLSLDVEWMVGPKRIDKATHDRGLITASGKPSPSFKCGTIAVTNPDYVKSLSSVGTDANTDDGILVSEGTGAIQTGKAAIFLSVQAAGVLRLIMYDILNWSDFVMKLPVAGDQVVEMPFELICRPKLTRTVGDQYFSMYKPWA